MRCLSVAIVCLPCVETRAKFIGICKLEWTVRLTIPTILKLVIDMFVPLNAKTPKVDAFYAIYHSLSVIVSN